MRLASFMASGVRTFGIVKDNGVIDAGAKTEAQDLKQALIRFSPEDWERLDALNIDHGIDEISWLPVITNPDKILCVGINYIPHIKETGREPPEYPWLFVRFPNSLVGHGTPIVRPNASVRFDYEGELAVVISKPARHVSRQDAFDYVAGFSCFNDGSVRDYQRHSSQFTAGKNFVGSGSFGPWMTTADSVGDITDRELVTTLNGEVVQQAKIGELCFDIPALIEYCTTFTELMPGDVIATGTPGGVGFARTPPRWLEPGDQLRVAISGMGELLNPVIQEGESP